MKIGKRTERGKEERKDEREEEKIIEKGRGRQSGGEKYI